MKKSLEFFTHIIFIVKIISTVNVLLKIESNIKRLYFVFEFFYKSSNLI